MSTVFSKHFLVIVLDIGSKRLLKAMSRMSFGKLDFFSNYRIMIVHVIVAILVIQPGKSNVCFLWDVLTRFSPRIFKKYYICFHKLLKRGCTEPYFLRISNMSI